jgi:hypothetical protein
MWFGSGLVLIVLLGVFAWAIVEAFAADPDRVRGLPKTIWVVIILLFFSFGAVAWFIFGRPRRSAMSRPAPRTSNWGGTPPVTARRAAPMAPDDDPEFLFRLREQLRNKPDDDQLS